jgi:hypothetical protein
MASLLELDRIYITGLFQMLIYVYITKEKRRREARRHFTKRKKWMMKTEIK